MIHYLTEAQYFDCWCVVSDRMPMGTYKRIDYWNIHCKLKYNLNYYESNDDEDSPEYWGSLEGDEKDINWFLLQL
jgi:hypothetical protein